MYTYIYGCMYLCMCLSIYLYVHVNIFRHHPPWLCGHVQHPPPGLRHRRLVPVKQKFVTRKIRHIKKSCTITHWFIAKTLDWSAYFDQDRECWRWVGERFGHVQHPPPVLRHRCLVPVKRFRGELVFKAHGRLYHSTVGSRVINKKTWQKKTSQEKSAHDFTQFTRVGRRKIGKVRVV